MAESGKPGTNWKQVGKGERKKLGPLIAHYRKKAHPFTACVNDNTKRFGKERAERVCAVLKDLMKRTTKWRNGGEVNASRTPGGDIDFDMEGYLLSLEAARAEVQQIQLSEGEITSCMVMLERLVLASEQDEREMQELDPERYAVALFMARQRYGMDGLDLAIDFDPQAHPRDPKGRFREVISKLQPGEMARLPDGVEVERRRDPKGGSKYAVRGADQPSSHFDREDNAAGSALARSLNHEHENALGGNQRVETRLTNVDEKLKEAGVQSDEFKVVPGKDGKGGGPGEWTEWDTGDLEIEMPDGGPTAQVTEDEHDPDKPWSAYVFADADTNDSESATFATAKEAREWAESKIDAPDTIEPDATVEGDVLTDEDESRSPSDVAKALQAELEEMAADYDDEEQWQDALIEDGESIYETMAADVGGTVTNDPDNGRLAIELPDGTRIRESDSQGIEVVSPDGEVTESLEVEAVNTGEFGRDPDLQHAAEIGADVESAEEVAKKSDEGPSPSKGLNGDPEVPTADEYELVDGDSEGDSIGIGDNEIFVDEVYQREDGSYATLKRVVNHTGGMSIWAEDEDGNEFVELDGSKYKALDEDTVDKVQAALDLPGNKKKSGAQIAREVADEKVPDTPGDLGDDETDLSEIDVHDQAKISFEDFEEGKRNVSISHPFGEGTMAMTEEEEGQLAQALVDFDGQDMDASGDPTPLTLDFHDDATVTITSGQESPDGDFTMDVMFEHPHMDGVSVNLEPDEVDTFVRALRGGPARSQGGAPRKTPKPKAEEKPDKPETPGAAADDGDQIQVADPVAARQELLDLTDEDFAPTVAKMTDVEVQNELQRQRAEADRAGEGPEEPDWGEFGDRDTAVEEIVNWFEAEIDALRENVGDESVQESFESYVPIAGEIAMQQFEGVFEGAEETGRGIKLPDNTEIYIDPKTQKVVVVDGDQNAGA